MATYVYRLNDYPAWPEEDMTMPSDLLEEKRQFMAENPVMDAPPGWRLAPEFIEPEDDENPTEGGDGWYCLDANGDTRHAVEELPGGADMPVVRLLAAADPRVVRIELWRGSGTVSSGVWWAATRC